MNLGLLNGPSLADSFDPRSNSIGFLRFALATVVLVSHSWRLGGFGLDPVEAWIGRRMTLGDVAVDGFFLISGYLISASLMHIRSTTRYMWHRFLRIFPGFWVCLVVTAFVFGPLFWIASQGTYRGFVGLDANPPSSYVLRNALLTIRQDNIDHLFRSSPYPFAINGSLWTLTYEFQCYLALALVGALGLRRFAGRLVLPATLAVIVIVGLNVIPSTWKLAGISPGITAEFAIPFALGSCAYFFADRIPINGRLAAIGAMIYILSLPLGLYAHVGLIGLGYGLLWLALRLPARSFDRRGDFSYGMYMYAFPVEQGLAMLGVRVQFIFVIAAFIITLPLAVLSYFGIERRALRLKGLRIRGRWRRSPVSEATGGEG